MAAAAAVDDWTQAKAKGNQAYQAGNHQQAIKHFTTAIQLETPKNEGKQLHILYSNRSAAELSLGLAHEALADAKKCTELEPTFAKGWSRVGAALYRLGRYPEAMAAYESGLQQTPGNADLTRALAEARKAADDTRVPSLNELLPKMQTFLLKHRLDGRLFLPRVFLFLNAFLYLFPFLLPAGWGLASYRRALYTTAAMHLYSLYFAHGTPKFKLEYLAQLMQDPHASPLFLSLLLLSFKGKAYFLGLAPLLLTEGMQALWFLSEVLSLAQPIFGKSLSARNIRLASLYTRNPKYGTLPSGPERWQALFAATSSHAITLEICMGLFLILELLTPWRNIFGLFLFWQYLQMRYMLDKNGEVKSKFKLLDERCLNLTSHPKCPAVVGQAYGMLRGYLGRAVAMPDPQQQEQQQQQGGMGGGMPRCSVM